MKRVLLPLAALTLATNLSLAGNWFGPGPFANGTYFPGNLDGKYQASVTGVNTAGVLGFAIRDGSIAFREQAQRSAGSEGSVIVNTQLQVDETVNYYFIFVNGQTFSGTTAAGINYNNSSVFGTLLGTQPTTLTNTNSQITTQLVTNVTTTNQTITIDDNGVLSTTNITSNLTNVETVTITNQVLNPVLIATGVDGSFQANIASKTAIFTFQGPGQLTYPGPVSNGQQMNPTTEFNVNGIRVSFSSGSQFGNVTAESGTQ